MRTVNHMYYKEFCESLEKLLSCSHSVFLYEFIKKYIENIEISI